MGAAGQGGCAGGCGSPRDAHQPKGMDVHPQWHGCPLLCHDAWQEEPDPPWAVTLQYKDRSLDEHVWVSSFLPAQAVPIPLGRPRVLAPGSGCSQQHHIQGSCSHHHAAPTAPEWAPGPSSALKLLM